MTWNPDAIAPPAGDVYKREAPATPYLLGLHPAVFIFAAGLAGLAWIGELLT